MKNNKIIWRSIGLFAIAVGLVVYYLKGRCDMARAGQVGDSFNGLLAPFISFAGALLVYLSFKEQLEANRLISTQWSFDLHLRMFEGIKADFEKIKILLPARAGQKETLYGLDALISVTIAWDDVQRAPEALIEFEMVTKELVFLINKIDSTKIDNKDYLLNKIALFYTSVYKEISQDIIKTVDKPGYNYGRLVAVLRELETVKNKLPLK